MKVGLGPGDFVLDWDLAPLPQKGCRASRIFGPCLLWPNGWMDEDANWYGNSPRPRPHCVRPSFPAPAKGAQKPPFFSAHVYCGHGRPSQLLLSSCSFFISLFVVIIQSIFSNICQPSFLTLSRVMVINLKKIPLHLKLPTLKYRRLRGDMIEAFKTSAQQ